MRLANSCLRALCGLAFVLCASVAAKADPITIDFEDVNAAGGAQAISENRYVPQGVHIFNHANRDVFVTSVGYTSNYAFAQRAPGEIGDGSLGFEFYVPGTDTRAVTTYVSFDVVDPGGTTQFYAYFWGRDGFLGEVQGSGNSHVFFTSGVQDIIYFFIAPTPQDTSGGIIGVDNFTFNTPTAVPAPEPATLLLLGTGLSAAAAAGRGRRRRANTPSRERAASGGDA
ncbi:MAG TPA: PEP-CTERM sorting domain-containing protein [Pyrinomonadaceae bacterium]|nr:PEP-CTERM sorting domain-containing protein [Pyrinomonadaceae bacterium]